MSRITYKEIEERKPKTYKMMLWFAMVSMSMVFAGLTSAYVVSKSRPDWLSAFELPIAFTWSTLIVVLSSFTFFLAQNAIKNDNRQKTTLFLIITLLLGVAFVFSQFLGFDQVIESGFRFTGEASTVTTSFIYIVVIAHLFHLAGGIIALLITLYKHLVNKYSGKDYLGIELSAMFWHFLGFLWMYLFLFFYFYK